MSFNYEKDSAAEVQDKFDLFGETAPSYNRRAWLSCLISQAGY